MPTIITRTEFYLDCIKRAFSGKLALAELISGLLALVTIPLGLWVFPDAGGIMNWIPLAIFLAVFVGTVVA